MSKNILIAVLVILLLLFISNDSTRAVDPIITYDTLYKDTTIIKWKRGKNIPFIVLDTFYQDTIKHDTISLKSEIRAYSDTFKIDSSVFTIQDTIKGELLGRSFKADIKEKIIIVNKTTQIPDKSAIYIGGGASFNTINAGIQYKKGKQLIGLSINSDRSINLSYYIKLF